MSVTDYGQSLKTIRKFIPVNTMTGVLPVATAGSTSTTLSGITYVTGVTDTLSGINYVTGVTDTTSGINYVSTVSNHTTNLSYISSVTPVMSGTYVVGLTVVTGSLTVVTGTWTTVKPYSAVVSTSAATTTFSGVVSSTAATATFSGVTGITGSVETVYMTSLGAGTPVISEHSVTAAEILSMKIGAAGDEVYHVWKIPPHLDRNQDIQFRPIFSTSSTDADAPVWKVFYQGVADVEAIADITTHETLSLTHTVSTTANALEIPNWIDSASASYITATDGFIKIRLECDSLGGASANEIELIGLGIRYAVKATADVNLRQPISTADLTTNY